MFSCSQFLPQSERDPYTHKHLRSLTHAACGPMTADVSLFLEDLHQSPELAMIFHEQASRNTCPHRLLLIRSRIERV